MTISSYWVRKGVACNVLIGQLLGFDIKLHFMSTRPGSQGVTEKKCHYVKETLKQSISWLHINIETGIVFFLTYNSATIY
jgi:hypothetical protein